MFSIEDFNTIKQFLDHYNISYDAGAYYNDSDQIVGHWMKINCDIETWEVLEDENEN